MRPILENVSSGKLNWVRNVAKTKSSNVNNGQINILVLNHENIFCEIKFLIYIHEITSVKFAIFETQFAKVSPLEIFSHENIFS